MKLLEYEAKEFLRRYGLPTPAGTVRRAGEAAAVELPAVVKAQVPVGGRGKAGGVKAVETAAELEAACADLLGHELLGHTVRSVLIEEQLKPQRELYLAVTLDRAEQAMVVLAHTEGGVDINEAAGTALKVPLTGGIEAAVAARVNDYFGFSEALRGQLEKVLRGLYELSVQEDATLVEVNPLMVTDRGLVCADAKIELDDDAAFRHTDREFEAQPASAQFVVLSPAGTIASLANGAGLAMATNDAIAAAGQEPANFFDVGGGTSTAGMTAGFAKIRALPNVRAIVVNIFAGITRCDEVAAAILAARAADPRTPPLFVRLAGTNAEAGAQMLEAAGLKLWPTLGDCVREAAKEVGGA